MPRRRMRTRVLREILRLKSLGRSVREIRQGLNASVGSVSALIRKAGEAGDRLDEFLEDYPTVTHDQAIAVLESAKAMLAGKANEVTA